MDVFTDVVVLSHNIDNLVGKVFRVWGCESESDLREGWCCLVEQLCKSWAWAWSNFVQFWKFLWILVFKLLACVAWVVVTVDILAQECYLFDAFTDQLLNFIHYAAERSTSLPSPDKWHDAKWTHIVAAPHYGHVCLNRVGILPNRCYFSICLFDTQLHVHCCLSCLSHLDQPRQLPIRIWSTHNMHPSLDHLLLDPLSHASQHCHYLVFLQFINPLINLLFCWLPYGTRIQHHNLCRLLICLLIIFRQDAPHQLRIIRIHLTAIRLNKISAFGFCTWYIWHGATLHELFECRYAFCP